eukprot:1512056-Pyramimonas_sp.AAC.1
MAGALSAHARCAGFRAPHEAAVCGAACRPHEQWRPRGAGVAHGGVGARAVRVWPEPAVRQL